MEKYNKNHEVQTGGLIELDTYPVKVALGVLLKDRTTRKNILWATDTYSSFGPAYSDGNEITPSNLINLSTCVIQPRISKALEQKIERTKKRAEVFTPAWICNKMNNYCDEEWFDRKNVFNRELDNNTWEATTEPIEFPNDKKKTWKKYVDSKRLEITCGEAPYLVSRYDAETGKKIDIHNRIGILDRKLRVINENTSTVEEWMEWVIRAFQSVYGYEYQGDNLLIARINLFETFVDYLQDRWKRIPTEKEAKLIARIVSWNLWQMDGLSYTVPTGLRLEEFKQLELTETLEVTENKEKEATKEPVLCKIHDWRGMETVSFVSLRKET